MQRTSEIGVRIALGAQASDIARLIARRGGAPVLARMLIGIAGAFALTRYLRSLLYGITPADPVTFAAVAIVMAAATVIAMMVPARRASRVDPTTAMRHE